MTAITLERVLSEAETLPADEQAMLEELLRKHRIDGWREQTAADARKAARAVRSSKLEPVENVIARQRTGLPSHEKDCPAIT